MIDDERAEGALRRRVALGKSAGALSAASDLVERARALIDELARHIESAEFHIEDSAGPP